MTTAPSLRRAVKKTPTEWVEQETAGCRFGERRLDKRFARILDDLCRSVGQPLPYACQG
jgi:hypothetical protein